MRGKYHQNCKECGILTTLDDHRGIIRVYDENNMLVHTQTMDCLSFNHNKIINHYTKNMCPFCRGYSGKYSSLYSVEETFLEDIKPLLAKLKRFWKIIKEFKEFIKTQELKGSKKALFTFIYALSDFEVSLATDYQEKYGDLDGNFVFDTICQEKSC